MKRAKGFPCRWHCGGRTPNRSGICDKCWARRDEIRLERMEAKRSKLSQARRDTLAKVRSVRPARRAIPSIEMADTGVSGVEDA